MARDGGTQALVRDLLALLASAQRGDFDDLRSQNPEPKRELRRRLQEIDGHSRGARYRNTGRPPGSRADRDDG